MNANYETNKNRKKDTVTCCKTREVSGYKSIAPKSIHAPVFGYMDVDRKKATV